MMSLSLPPMACGAVQRDKAPGPSRNGAGRAACAIQGRRGARVALLQSPILPAASLAYRRKTNRRPPSR